MPPGRGPGPGRGRARRHARRANRAQQYADPAPAPAGEKQKEAAAAAPKEEVVVVQCEFPRCENLPEYGFADKGAIAEFCADHKSDEMVLLVADPNNPKESSLELVRKYHKLETDLEALHEAPEKSDACKAGIKQASADIYKEETGIKQLTKSLEELGGKLEDQEKKTKFTGKTLFGKGRLFQDQGVIDQLSKDKEANEAKVVKLKGQKEIDELYLVQLRKDLPALAKPAAEYAKIDETMKKLKATAIDDEASALYLALKAKGGKKKKELFAEGEVIFERLEDKAEEE
mmetsp:Transcript_13591/g.24582  ORF Transcript_13591/g.24582 Transcript_13591/m.24582 type:complete len:288 (+) Transcript_13591:126-989(+)